MLFQICKESQISKDSKIRQNYHCVALLCFYTPPACDHNDNWMRSLRNFPNSTKTWLLLLIAHALNNRNLQLHFFKVLVLLAIICYMDHHSEDNRLFLEKRLGLDHRKIINFVIINDLSNPSSINVSV